MGNLGTLFCYEVKKIFKRKMVKAALAVSLAVCMCPFILPLFGSYVVNGEVVDSNYHMMRVDREYQEKLNGRLIDQTLLEETMEGYAMIPEDAALYIVTEEYQKYARPYSAVFQFMRSTSGMTTAEALRWEADEEDLRAKRLAKLEQEYDACLLSEGEKDFWRRKEELLQWPVRFEITEGYYSLFAGLSTICVILPLCLAVCLSQVFTEEHTRRTDQLILCGRKGLSTVYLAKILAGVSFAVLCSFMVSLLAFMLSFAIYGAGGFNAAVQLLYESYSFPLTAGQAVLIMYGVLLAASALLAVMIMVLSEALRNGMASLAVMAAYLIAAMMIVVPDRYRILWQIWNWLPGAFVTPWNILDLRLFPFLGQYFTPWQAVPVLYLFAGLLTAAAGLPVYRRYQVSGR